MKIVPRTHRIRFRVPMVLGTMDRMSVTSLGAATAHLGHPQASEGGNAGCGWAQACNQA
jgi:hypothetical protein